MSKTGDHPTLHTLSVDPGTTIPRVEHTAHRPSPDRAPREAHSPKARGKHEEARRPADRETTGGGAPNHRAQPTHGPPPDG